MKPRVFLSHSKMDKDFIIKIANDLRIAQIDSWYDDWEIPPGTSIRKKIFEEGIPDCDVFFVYLSENSIGSYWVSKELDAAMTLQAENRNDNIVLFCSSEAVRSKLSVDLRSCNIPVLTENDYLNPMLKFIAKIYQNFTNNAIKKIKAEQQSEVLVLKNQILELQNILLQSKDGTDLKRIRNQLAQIKISFNSKSIDLLYILEQTKNSFAAGANINKLDKQIANLFDYYVVEQYLRIEPIIPNNLFDDIIGPLVIYKVLEIIPETDSSFKSYQLTDFGKELLMKLE